MESRRRLNKLWRSDTMFFRPLKDHLHKPISDDGCSIQLDAESSEIAAPRNPAFSETRSAAAAAALTVLFSSVCVRVGRSIDQAAGPWWRRRPARKKKSLILPHSLLPCCDRRLRRSEEARSEMAAVRGRGTRTTPRLGPARTAERRMRAARAVGVSTDVQQRRCMYVETDIQTWPKQGKLEPGSNRGAPGRVFSLGVGQTRARARGRLENELP